MTEPFPSAIASVSDDIARQRENVRAELARWVMALLTVVAIGVAVLVISKGSAAEVLATALFTPVVGIAGTVLGFYFGSQEGT